MKVNSKEKNLRSNQKEQSSIYKFTKKEKKSNSQTKKPARM